MTRKDRDRRKRLATAIEAARTKIEAAARRLRSDFESTPEFMHSVQGDLEDAERALFVATQEIADVYL